MKKEDRKLVYQRNIFNIFDKHFDCFKREYMRILKLEDRFKYYSAISTPESETSNRFVARVLLEALLLEYYFFFCDSNKDSFSIKRLIEIMENNGFPGNTENLTIISDLKNLTQKNNMLIERLIICRNKTIAHKDINTGPDLIEADDIVNLSILVKKVVDIIYCDNEDKKLIKGLRNEALFLPEKEKNKSPN